MSNLEVPTPTKFPIPVTQEAFAYRPGIVGISELLRSVNYLRSIFPPSVSLMKVLREDPIEESTISRGEKLAARNISKIFQLDSEMEPSRFILSQLKTANKVTECIRETLNIPKGRLNDEIDMEDPRILRIMTLLLRNKGKGSHIEEKGVSDKLSYELRRQLLLAVISGRLHMNTVTNKPRELASDLQYAFNKHFYTDEKTGDTTEKAFITTHNRATNEIIKYREHERTRVYGPLPDDQKSVSLQFRHTRLDDGTEVEVYSSDRKKNDVGAIIKAIAKAGPQMEIDPIQTVEDTIGKRFVVNGDNDLRDRFMEKYIQTITTLYPDVNIIPDDSVNTGGGTDDRGQSSKTDYRRVKVFFNGKSTPYEAICYSLKDFLNSKVEVGSQNSEGIYNGQAHVLYNLRRMAKVARILFPEELYDYNLDHLLKAEMQLRVNQLLAAREINYE